MPVAVITEITVDHMENRATNCEIIIQATSNSISYYAKLDNWAQVVTFMAGLGSVTLASYSLLTLLHMLHAHCVLMQFYNVQLHQHNVLLYEVQIQ